MSFSAKLFFGAFMQTSAIERSFTSKGDNLKLLGLLQMYCESGEYFGFGVRYSLDASYFQPELQSSLIFPLK